MCSIAPLRMQWALGPADCSIQMYRRLPPWMTLRRSMGCWRGFAEQCATGAGLDTLVNRALGSKWVGRYCCYWRSATATALVGAIVAGCGGSASGGSATAGTGPGNCPSPEASITLVHPADGTVTYAKAIYVGGANNSGGGTPTLYIDGVRHSYTDLGYGAFSTSVPLRMGPNRITVDVGKLCTTAVVRRRAETQADRVAAAKVAARRRRLAATKAANRRRRAAAAAARRRADAPRRR